tara:strand:+ start:12259 stop:12777 length:519 start_codon:yes stop_codon:yes gene_type:complete
MNRRQFTQRLAALAAAPALPAGLASKVMATPIVKNNQAQLWATFVARIHDKASPQMFKRQLSLSDEQARDVFNTLVKDKVLSAPNAQGVSHAMNPFKRNLSTGLASSPQSAFKPKPEKAVENRIKDMLDSDDTEKNHNSTDDSDPVNQMTPQCVDDTEPNIIPDDDPAPITT